MAIKSDSYLASLFGLEGKTIVVTGAGGGIGLAISEGLLRAGAEVALCNRTTAKCKPLADRLNAEGGTASVHKLDVTSLDSIHACVDEVMARYGKIDVLFNVAGINKREGFLDVEEADYDRIMDTNLKGLFFMSQTVAREMYRRRTGSIINIGSHNDEGMLGGCSVYGATKSGVVALTRAMAIEFAQYGIRANAISPGHILTDLTQVTWDHPTRAPWLRERIAMKRPAAPEELVGMAILLALRCLQLHDRPGVPHRRRLSLRWRPLGLRYPVQSLIRFRLLVDKSFRKIEWKNRVARQIAAGPQERMISMYSVNMPTMDSVARFKAAMDSDKGALGPFMIGTDPAFCGGRRLCRL